MTETALKKITNYFDLFLLNIKVKFGNFIEYMRVVSNYYSNSTFAKIDSYLVFSYLFNNPFVISKRFLLSRNEPDVYTYGETPLTSLEDIAKECRLSSKDVVFELGCGRGRTCYWLNQFIGCSVVGIDYVPEFIKRASEVKSKFGIENVQFRLEDILDSDFKGVTVIYMCGTCFSDEFILKLVKRFNTLPKGTKIISVSYPLSDYSKDNSYEIMKRFPIRFSWGLSDVYLQVKL
ncbi:MAG: class I SAM-dependent methyltransferase [Parachlamydiaceae bacterium]|nr:class I SAM-dependent methyltransferase [Parachlamydiaceae bacterium]